MLKLFCSYLPPLSVFLGSCRKLWRSWRLSVMWLSCFLKMEVGRELPSLLQLQKDCITLDRSRNELWSNSSPARRVQQGFVFKVALPNTTTKVPFFWGAAGFGPTRIVDFCPLVTWIRCLWHYVLVYSVLYFLQCISNAHGRVKTKQNQPKCVFLQHLN